MSGYNFDWNPYTIDPSMYVQQALTPMPYAPAQMPEMTPERKSFGPMHETLHGYFQQALMNQLAVPGLLNQWQNDAGAAQHAGGLLGGYYTPSIAEQPYHIDWAKAAATAKANDEALKSASADTTTKAGLASEANTNGG
ncbi:hypothetical protein UFOVP62_15 [uncultured Caudovirales phage]|uniref:Uncharacterized protein n=1 Tax=uncultured Caudovirales phage TaxID=2100421 RepID=A0A6J5KTJ5_9CAUD|nr:hypothetical protein UFOVP62_15 [uncultured Caudovirales phage]